MSSAAKPAMEKDEVVTFDDLKAKASELKAKASDVAETAKKQAADFKQRAIDTMKHPRESAANLMDATASTISQRAENLDRDSKMRTGALQVADKLEGGADYLRTHQADKMLDDAEDFVMDHPGITMISAAVAGFLIGYAVFHDRD